MIRSLTAALIAAVMSAPAAAGAMEPHASQHRPATGAPAATAPTEPGQSAFAAIQEIVALLEADPATDWSAVDVEALRRHLADMDDVTLRSQVRAESVDGGARFVATGPGPVGDAIRRMVLAHAAAMDEADGWRFSAVVVDGGAALTVLVPPDEVEKVRALGFLGVMTRGMHHQDHHLAIARGGHPHE